MALLLQRKFTEIRLDAEEFAAKPDYYTGMDLRPGDIVGYATSHERVYELRCDCGRVGGEIRFPEDHGRESDEALEAELAAAYSHSCEEHAPTEL